VILRLNAISLLGKCEQSKIKSKTILNPLVTLNDAKRLGEMYEINLLPARQVRNRRQAPINSIALVAIILDRIVLVVISSSHDNSYCPSIF
jgi:hypothetical protein